MSAAAYFPATDANEDIDHLLDDDDADEDPRTQLDKTSTPPTRPALLCPVLDNYIGDVSSPMFTGTILGAVGWGTCLEGAPAAFDTTLFFTALFGILASFSFSYSYIYIRSVCAALSPGYCSGGGHSIPLARMPTTRRGTLLPSTRAITPSRWLSGTSSSPASESSRFLVRELALADVDATATGPLRRRGGLGGVPGHRRRREREGGRGVRAPLGAPVVRARADGAGAGVAPDVAARGRVVWCGIALAAGAHRDEIDRGGRWNVFVYTVYKVGGCPVALPVRLRAEPGAGVSCAPWCDWRGAHEYVLPAPHGTRPSRGPPDESAFQGCDQLLGYHERQLTSDPLRRFFWFPRWMTLACPEWGWAGRWAESGSFPYL
ncbi:hypothetical protein DFH08DRAFT_799224 [Mycena albidolilacea]|uniref:Uncharacterized protein n=1 Tax=Mycena albidolilacea TaxID=1033008 RepID=A0AAD7F4U3_9AGAR|nr:hypothetical protein DFH08DRAFT_799224 [Mycena albidolilacea]